MSDAYRDELNAALAANESLRDELKTLKQSLEQERDTVRRQQEMLRGQGVPMPRTPSDNRRSVIVAVAVGLGLMCAMCAAGMVFFTISRGSVSAVREEQHILVPAPPVIPPAVLPEVTPPTVEAVRPTLPSGAGTAGQDPIQGGSAR